MQDAVGDFLLYESVTRENKSLHPHIHSNACLCEYMSHGDWAHVSAILSQVFDFTSRFYDTYKISHRKRQAVTLLGMRVCVCVCVCVCACTCTCTSKDAERKCICCAAKTTSYRPSPCSSSRFPVLFCHLSACILHIYMPTRNVKYICLKQSGWGYSSK